jgi:Leucine-rich repeat (LRR) protein
MIDDCRQIQQFYSTFRLGFLNIGPELVNLNLDLANVTTIFLQYNKLTTIHLDAFEGCPNLKFLALQGNLIENLPDISYLTQLEFLDLSSNNLSSLSPYHIPRNLVVLKLHGNPLTTLNSDNKYEYRRPFVLELHELD